MNTAYICEGKACCEKLHSLVSFCLAEKEFSLFKKTHYFWLKTSEKRPKNGKYTRL